MPDGPPSAADRTQTEPPDALIEIDAVLVHFGEAAGTLAALRALAASRGVGLGVVLVDNGPRVESSGSGSPSLEAGLEALKGSFARGASSLRPERNLGYAAGLNAGIRAARERRPPDFVFLMNHDLEVAPDALSALAAALRRDPRAAAAGPLLLAGGVGGVGERIWNAGSRIEWPSARPRSLLHGAPLSEAPRAAQEVEYLAGCAVLLRADVLANLGALPEEYFLYFEDAELGERLRAGGWRSILVPEARALHRAGAASSRVPELATYYQTRNRLLFSRRWAPPGWGPRWARGLFAIRRFLAGGAARAGVIDAWRGRWGERGAAETRCPSRRSQLWALMAALIAISGCAEFLARAIVEAPNRGEPSTPAVQEIPAALAAAAEVEQRHFAVGPPFSFTAMRTG